MSLIAPLLEHEISVKSSRSTPFTVLASNDASSVPSGIRAIVVTVPAWNRRILALQAELSNTEDRLQTARRFYNGNVRDYNSRVQSFPSMIVANVGNFELEEFFEVDESLRGDAGVPKVDFSSMSSGAPPAPATPPASSPTEPPASGGGSDAPPPPPS